MIILLVSWKKPNTYLSQQSYVVLDQDHPDEELVRLAKEQGPDDYVITLITVYEMANEPLRMVAV